MPGDEIAVKGVTNADEVRLMVLLQSETPDPNNPDAVDVTPVGENFSADVPYAGNQASPPETGAYKVVGYPIVNGTLGGAVVVNFTRRAETEQQTVSAKCCLWYALAANGAAGPFPEEDPVGPFLPVPVRIPLNAESVSFEADSEQIWQHFTDDGSRANADGRANLSTDLEVQDYQAANLGSQVISSIDTNVCKLLGLWKTAANQYEQFEIGLSAMQNIPLTATLDGTLYLGMHDGKRWFNNCGDIDVTIEWST